MQFVDTHCHIDFPVYDGSRDAVISEAAIAGVHAIVVPAVTAESWKRLLQITSDQYASQLYPALGLHPCFMQQHKPEDLARLEELLSGEAVCAVGEIGLDLFISDPDFDTQLFFFKAQLELAARYELPVLLHVRKAHDLVLKELRQARLQRGGIVHAFSGSLQQAQQYISLGFKLGIGGTITYSRAKKLRAIVQTLEMSNLVLETDAPDMPLAAYRGLPNRPARIREIAAVVAGLKGVPIAELAALTTGQARALFGF
ncbi:MAG: DNAase [Neptuniibacter caesariensis]|uniref:DNAase n=1 Tax=Neptuniibacter caesariensis TaxID=207954 RepID=A0A2G6JNK8_NEPCE|nr:MAG: DNAase [Neptuniibacter caesariensis]